MTAKYTLTNPHTTDTKKIVGPYLTRGTTPNKKYFHMTADPALGFKAGMMLQVHRVAIDLVVLSLIIRVGVIDLSSVEGMGPLGESELKLGLAKYLSLSGDKDERILDASKLFRVFLKPIHVGISAGTLDVEKVRAALESGLLTDAVVDAFQKQTKLTVNTTDAEFMAALTNLIAWNLAPHFKGLFQSDFAAAQFGVTVDADEFSILAMTEAGTAVAAAKKEAQKATEELMAKYKHLKPEALIELDEEGNPIPGAASPSGEVSVDGGGVVGDDLTPDTPADSSTPDPQ